VLRIVLLHEESRVSRRQIVTEQDERANQFEPNLHDGPRRQLVALGVQLSLGRRLAERDAREMARTFDAFQVVATRRVENLRDLARGTYPTPLADWGLVAALEAQVRKALLPV
jgi:signal transduction histidine kinase